MYSMIRYRKIDSTGDLVYFKTSDLFKVLSGHDEEIFGTEEIDLKYIPHTPSTVPPGINNDASTAAATSLPDPANSL